jgi:hypothetical protein
MLRTPAVIPGHPLYSGDSNIPPPAIGSISVFEDNVVGWPFACGVKHGQTLLQVRTGQSGPVFCCQREREGCWYATTNRVAFPFSGYFMKRLKAEDRLPEIVCPACDGSGLQKVKQPDQPGRRVYPPACKECAGKGRIALPRT